MENKYKPTIGLEIHMELNTKTKMFCGCKNNPDEPTPNTNVCPICLAHPGTLPLANREAIRSVLKLGLALNGQIAEISKFDRKNYFYPDLPKGYQISQFDLPFISQASLEIPLAEYPSTKKIRITRVHLEEDAGGLSHADDKSSLVDFNRAGVPLAELVTEPDISSGYEARTFAEELQRILRYLGVSNANMEKGEMRCEVNISISKDEKLGTKVEIKNLNSFKVVEQCIDYEIKRQEEVLERGEKVIQETRGWDEVKNQTFSQRTKEDAHDYRYFPEPDLPVIRPADLFDIEEIKGEIVELPAQKRSRFMEELGLSFSESFLLVDNKETADFFEKISEVLDKESIKLAYNYFTSDLKGLLVKEGIKIQDLKFSPSDFANLIKLISKKEVSSLAAKKILNKMTLTGKKPEDIIQEDNLAQISDVSAISEFISTVIEKNQSVAEEYKKGKENALQFLIGQVMAISKGKANPELVKEEMKKALS